MPRKVSFSFLGTGAYQPTEYFFPGPNQHETYSTPLIQLAVQGYLQDKEGFGPTDQHILMLTDSARKRNYLSAQVPRGTETASHEGLQKELVKRAFQTVTKEVAVPTGHDQNSIIQLFDIVVAQVSEGDEIYLDITHGFRSLPMLSIVLADFLRVTKRATVRAVYYGAFEDRHEYDGRTPIYDLTYFIELQKWSTAAYGYLRYGFVTPLVELSKGQTVELLRSTKGQHRAARAVQQLIDHASTLAQQLRTNRGHELYLADSASKIQLAAEQLSGGSVVERGPLPLLMQQLAKKSEGFQVNGQLNWLIAARLAFEDGLIQQTCSLLREGIVSYICRQSGIDPGKEKDRKLVEQALNAMGGKVTADKEYVSVAEFHQYEVIKSNSSAQQLTSLFYSLSPYRNDLMHAGYYTQEGGNNARRSTRIVSKVEAILDEVERKLLP